MDLNRFEEEILIRLETKRMMALRRGELFHEMIFNPCHNRTRGWFRKMAVNRSRIGDSFSVNRGKSLRRWVAQRVLECAAFYRTWNGQQIRTWLAFTTSRQLFQILRLDALSANCEIFFTTLDSNARRLFVYIVMPIYIQLRIKWGGNVDNTKMRRKSKLFLFSKLILERRSSVFEQFSPLNFPFIPLVSGTKPIVLLSIHGQKGEEDFSGGSARKFLFLQSRRAPTIRHRSTPNWLICFQRDTRFSS